MAGKFKYEKDEGAKRRLYIASAIVILALAILTVGSLVQVPVTANVIRTVTEPAEFQETVIEPVCTTEMVETTETVCGQEEFDYVLNENLRTVQNPDTDTGWQCIATFYIDNKEPKTGTWFYDYEFTRGDGYAEAKDGQISILPNKRGTVALTFPCDVGDEVSGELSIVAPTLESKTCSEVAVTEPVEKCEDKEVTRTVIKDRTVTEERPETQYKTPFQIWFGG